MEYKTLYKGQVEYIISGKVFGLEILVCMDRPINEKDSAAGHRAAELLEDLLERETQRLDPEAAKNRATVRADLLALFGNRQIFVEEIPNGYCHSACCSQKPWYIVTTNKGRITIGWRKRVIQITWEPSVAGHADTLFMDDVTKDKGLIHAWGYEKAKEYIERLLA